MTPRTPTAWIEPGAVRRVSEAIEQLGARRVAWVVDPVAYAASGAEDALADVVAATGANVHTVPAGNPQLEPILRLAQRLNDVEAVVAVGGGATVDTAKLLALWSRNPTSIAEVLAHPSQWPADAAPLIAVPTTAGTGSEATHFAVVYHQGHKLSVAHESLRPAWAIVDAGLSLSGPQPIRAASALDALCQSIESLWSTRSTPDSERDARGALGLLWPGVVSAVLDPSLDQQAMLARAAYLAGRAIDISRTTAPHALSYRLTSRHGVPHGFAVALTMPEVLRFNAAVTADDCTDCRGAEHTRAALATIVEALGQPDAEAAAGALTTAIGQLGGPVSWGEVGITGPEDRADLAESVNAERLGNNPRRLTRADILAVLETMPD